MDLQDYEGPEGYYDYYYLAGIYSEYVGGGGGGGGDDGLPVNPWADVDEDGVGTLGTFKLQERSDSLPQTAEWMGMAVGIFVEPVDWFMTAVEIYRDPTNPWAYIGLIPGIPAGAGRLVKKGINIASDVLRSLPGGIVFKLGDKAKGMDHILRRHSHISPVPNKGKFAAGMGQGEIGSLLDDALQRGGTWRDEGWARVYEVEMPNVIGVTQTGASTNKVRIVVDKADNTVQNAYPIP